MSKEADLLCPFWLPPLAFVGIDFTNRDLQGKVKDAGADWCLAKGANEFAAVSEFIHKSAVPDLSNVEIELVINGDIMLRMNLVQSFNFG